MLQDSSILCKILPLHQESFSLSLSLDFCKCFFGMHSQVHIRVFGIKINPIKPNLQIIILYHTGNIDIISNRLVKCLENPLRICIYYEPHIYCRQRNTNKLDSISEIHVINVSKLDHYFLLWICKHLHGMAFIKIAHIVATALKYSNVLNAILLKYKLWYAMQR